MTGVAAEMQFGDSWTDHLNTTVAPITMYPALPAQVHTSVTITIAVVCLLMTVVLCFQVLRIHLYGYRKLSYFYACLWMSLWWGVLRTYLLFQYAVHRNVASSLSLAVYIVLFVLPVCLQYATFSLVTLYFSTVLGGRAEWKSRWYWQTFNHVLWVGSNLGVLVVSIYSAVQLNSGEEKWRQVRWVSFDLLRNVILSV